MNALALSQLVADLLVILTAGLASGLVCKRFGISLLVGYLVVGALIGKGGFGLIGQENEELEYFARGGALLLLFAVGIEFSLEELIGLRRYFLIGGAAQMLLVAGPLVVVCRLFGMPWNAAILAASAGALSSTILVFKVLNEWGEMASPHGRRAIAILLFQDVALVPLMLLVPLLTGAGDTPTTGGYVVLALKSLVFLIAVLTLRRMVAWWFVPLLTERRSVELVVLFALIVLGGVCWGTSLVGLPPALGALAAGIVLSGNRLSKQIDTIVLPYRESFAAVFFVTLGMLLDPMAFFDEPLLLLAGLGGMLLLKSVAATLALRLVGLSWMAAAGMGIGLAQLGEFSFLLVAEGTSRGVVTAVDYNRMLFIALGTLILTPQLLKVGLRWAARAPDDGDEGEFLPRTVEPVQKALIIGVGVIGRQLASQLEMLGIDVCLVDLSPINLHAFAQQGFHTVAGDARDEDVLQRADVAHRRLVIVSVPDDDIANQVVRAVRTMAPTASILVRCRYQVHIAPLVRVGADAVVSEEAEASGALLILCMKFVARADGQHGAAAGVSD